jgi:hypothetical protein
MTKFAKLYRIFLKSLPKGSNVNLYKEDFLKTQPFNEKDLSLTNDIQMYLEALKL